ncbi:MAG: hypothetical protein V3V26_00500, partial [Candidatus Aenigmarchaeota archaeon]
WGCEACDTANNCAFSATNRTITIDTIAPAVSITNPVSQVYTTGTVELNYTASDVNLDSCWYEIGGSNTTLPGCADTTLALADGAYNLILWANDTATNTNSASVSFTVDTTNPEAFLGIYPVDDANFSANDINFSIYCTDNVAVDELQLWGDWTGWTLTARTNPANNTPWEAIVSGIPEGTWVWGSWCNDTANHQDWSDVNRTITVDRTNPLVEFVTNTPANGTYQSWNTVTMNVTHSDANPDTLLVYWNSIVVGNMPYAGRPSTPMTSPPQFDGVVNYYIWVNDTAGNSNQTETRTLTIDTTSPMVQFIANTPASGSSIAIGGTLYINVSHTELNQDSVILEVRGRANETFGYMTGSFTAITKSYGTGTYYYTVYLNDSAGNVNATVTRNVTFYVPPPPPPPAPGSSFTGSSGGYSPPICKENWNCTNWTTECINFEYTRTCSDENGCGTEKTRPAKAIACTLPSEDGPVAPSTLCTPGDMKCSGSNLVECDDDGSVWRLVVACEYGCENAVCKDEMVVSPSSGEAGLTGFFVEQGANVAAVVAGSLLIIGGAYYYFRIRRFKVL